MIKGLISIIIPNWNGAKFLADCIDSIYSQTCNQYEIIVVDNGSSDSSIEVLKSYPELKTILLDKNYGFAKACNLGILNAQGEYIALINNDVILNDDWIEQVIIGFQRNKDFDFMATKILCMDKSSVIDSAGFEISSPGAVYFYHGKKAEDPIVMKKRETFGAVATAAIYRTEVLTKIGLFDEDFFAYAEDTDLSFRARLAGFRCIYLPTVICRHFGSGTGKLYSPFHAFYVRRNSEYLFILNMQSYLFWKYLIPHIGYELASLMLYFRIGLAREWFRAKYEAIKMLKKNMKKRQERVYMTSIDLRKIEKSFMHRIFIEKFSKIRKGVIKIASYRS